MNTFYFKRLSGIPEELNEIQIVFEQTPQYFLNVSGTLPKINQAQEDFNDLPPQCSRDQKHFFGIYEENEIIGVADILKGFPDEKTAMIGLFLLHEAQQGQGKGSQIYHELEKIIRAWHEIKALRIAVVKTNSIVLPFWHKQGFRENGEIKPWVQEQIKTEVIILTKHLQ